MRLAALFASATIIALASCSGDDEPPKSSCVQVDTSCAPLYEPTYEQVFARTLKPSCALSGVSCHASTGAQGGLVFEDPAEAHQRLLDSGRVKPGDPACSELVRRLASTEPMVRMPPGRPLDAAEQCAIVRWIANGAAR